ncbi:MAG: tape measure protein [Xanthomonadaceae bacterium]|nr:tape measure protein [Xanthomonadaceae bacterium]MBH2008136.1 tape measure protein [Xanthomonadaceae bacterium]
MADPKIKYDIEANVKGDAEVGQLASKLEDLAKTLDGDLKTNANAAAAALRQLGDKQAAIQRFVELKQGAQDAAAKLNDAQAAAQKMGQTLAATETPTRGQTGAMQKLGDAVRAAKAEVLAQNVAVQNARGALQQYGVSTTNLAQSQQNVKAAVGAAKLEVNALVPAYAQAGQAATASGNQQRLANEGVGKSVASIGDQLRSIQNIAMIAVGGGFLGGIAKDALATADTFNNLQARIKLVTGEGALLTSSFQGVSDVALRTNSNLEQTGTLFARVAEAGKSAGLSAQQAAAQSLALTETINQSIQLSGGSAESSSAAITQLIQALQSGVLRGEEFNSIMEQSPRLAKALADGLNVTTGELRKMAETGSLTTDVVIRSLKSQSDTIKSEFASLPPTVGRAIENLNTSWTLFVGNLDKGAGISKTVAGAIDSLAGNLNTVLTVAGHAAVAWGGYTLSQKLAAAGSAQSAIAINQTALAATGQAVASGRAAVATSTHGKAAVLAAGQVAGYGAANTAAAAAANANAVQVAAGATGYRAIGGAVLTAASKFALWGTVAYEGYGILKSVGTALGEGVAKWQGYKNAEEVMAEQEKKLAAAAQATADAVYKQSEAARVAKDQSFGLSKEAGLLAVKFDTLVKAGDSASDAIGKIGKDFDLTRLPGIRDAAGVLDKLKEDGKLTAAEFQAAWAKALDGKDLAVFETTARAAFMGAKREAELLAQLLDAGLRESVKRSGLDFENLKGGISSTARSAVNDTQTIIDGLGRLSAQGVDTGRALAASIGKGIDTADTQKALDLVKQQIEAVRAKLGETVANGLLDQAKQKGMELKDALDKAMPGINSVREAMGQLGITSDQTFKDTAEKSKAAYDVMRTSGLASARELSEGFKKSAEDAIAANKGIAPSWVTAEAAARGYEVQVDSAGKATVRAAGEGVKGVDGLANAYKNAGDAAESAGNRAVSALEKQNAAQERLNAATDKAAELERKRQAIDKEGFSTGKDGQRVVAGSDVSTLTGVAAFLKAAGVSDDAAARKLALEFSDGKGNIPYINNAAQVKYGGSSSTMTQALLKAAETYTFGTGSGSAKSPSTIPAQTTTVNINLSGTPYSVNTDAAGAATLQNILRQLGSAQSTSSLR